MGFFKFILWTGCAIGIGIGMASFEIDGRTPLEHAQRAMRPKSALDKAKDFAGDVADDVEDAYDSAKKKLRTKNEPHEAHSDEDREAVNALITQRSKKK